jgi:hypothetical protein
MPIARRPRELVRRRGVLGSLAAAVASLVLATVVVVGVGSPAGAKPDPGRPNHPQSGKGASAVPPPHAKGGPPPHAKGGPPPHAKGGPPPQANSPSGPVAPSAVAPPPAQPAPAVVDPAPATTPAPAPVPTAAPAPAPAPEPAVPVTALAAAPAASAVLVAPVPTDAGTEAPQPANPAPELPDPGGFLPPALRGGADSTVVAEAARSFTALLLVGGLIGLFLAGQGRVTRRDPKLAGAPIRPAEREFR